MSGSKAEQLKGLATISFPTFWLKAVTATLFFVPQFFDASRAVFFRYLWCQFWRFSVCGSVGCKCSHFFGTESFSGTCSAGTVGHMWALCIGMYRRAFDVFRSYFGILRLAKLCEAGAAPSTLSSGSAYKTRGSGIAALCEVPLATDLDALAPSVWTHCQFHTGGNLFLPHPDLTFPIWLPTSV